MRAQNVRKYGQLIDPINPLLTIREWRGWRPVNLPADAYGGSNPSRPTKQKVSDLAPGSHRSATRDEDPLGCARCTVTEAWRAIITPMLPKFADLDAA